MEVPTHVSNKIRQILNHLETKNWKAAIRITTKLVKDNPSHALFLKVTTHVFPTWVLHDWWCSLYFETLQSVCALVSVTVPKKPNAQLYALGKPESLIESIIDSKTSITEDNLLNYITQVAKRLNRPDLLSRAYQKAWDSEKSKNSTALLYFGNKLFGAFVRERCYLKQQQVYYLNFTWYIINKHIMLVWHAVCQRDE